MRECNSSFHLKVKVEQLHQTHFLHSSSTNYQKKGKISFYVILFIHKISVRKKRHINDHKGDAYV